jgi:hypothetical protein
MVDAPKSLWVIPPDDRKRFEELGEAHVRQICNGEGFANHPLTLSARWWLAELDEKQRKTDEDQRKRNDAAMASNDAAMARNETTMARNETAMARNETTMERSIALQVEQTRLTQGVNKAAWVAACVAIGAALVALLAWIHPIH